MQSNLTGCTLTRVCGAVNSLPTPGKPLVPWFCPLHIARNSARAVIPHRGGEEWGLHLIVASGCEDLAEWLMVSRDAPRDNLWLGEPEVEDGYLAAYHRPGFGVGLNEATL